MQAKLERLPFGVGQLTPKYLTFVMGMLVLLAIGLLSYGRQLSEGHIITGLRDIGSMGGATWGLYIVFLIYFVGVSFAGITIAAMIRLLDVHYLKPISRIAELITVTALILAGLCILPDLGQPLRGITNLFRYARPQSPFFGTFTLVVSGYFFASLVYLYLASRPDAATCAQVPSRLQGLHRLWAAGYRGTPAEQHRRKVASFWLAIAILPLLVTAHSTLGFVFGLQVGRPGWHSALQAPGFVVMAGVSGVGLVILVAALFRRLYGAETRLDDRIFRWLGNLLMVLVLAYLYFMVVEWLTGAYEGHQHELKLTKALLGGDFASTYWLAVICLVVPLAILFGQWVRNQFSLTQLVVAGALVNVAAIAKRYLLVVPSQTHGTLLPYGTGSYSPTSVEYAVVLGVIALGCLIFAIFVKVFPVIDLTDGAE
ncbi:MAG: polysulfide reductase NrfD [Candidatus Schekmanbacteria bacterium]|nr:polysulfide reductase NrfD [Candidatus Schekmanbacteria bacterium]